MIFEPWKNGTETAHKVCNLFAQEEIFEPQKMDGSKPSDLESADLTGSFVALFEEADGPAGYILYVPRLPGVYEQHTAFLKPFRGNRAMDWIRLATRTMFIETDCIQIMTTCPQWLPETRILAKKMGAQELFSRQIGKRDGLTVSGDIFAQTHMQWAWANHLTFQKVGELWHDEVFKTLEPHHEDDAVHNAFLGLALTMGAKQPQKAVGVYNAFAVLAGYEPGRLMWADCQGNSLVDIGPASVVNSHGRVLAVFPKQPCQPLPPSPPPPEL